MTWKISKSFEFNYGHRIANQMLDDSFSMDEQCKCRFLHGHTASIEVTLQSEITKDGMVTDFLHLNWLKEWIDKNIDHKFLIDIKDPLLETWFGDFKNNPLLVKKSDGMGYVFDLGRNVTEDVVASFDNWKANKDRGISDSDVYEEKNLGEAHVSEFYESVYIVDFTPTSECLAKWIFEFVRKTMRPLPATLTSVVWHESPKTKAEYSEQIMIV